MARPTKPRKSPRPTARAGEAVGSRALRKVQGKPEPGVEEDEEEQIVFVEAEDLDDRKLAEEAKKEAERGFLHRFLRKDAPPRVELHEVPHRKPSLFRRRPSAQAEERMEARAAAAKARLEAKRTAREARRQARLAARQARGPKDASNATDERPHLKEEASQPADGPGAKAAAKRAKEEAKRQKEAAAAAASAERRAARARAAEERRLAKAARAGGEPVECANCKAVFPVPAGAAEATCPRCKSLLALAIPQAAAPTALPSTPEAGREVPKASSPGSAKPLPDLKAERREQKLRQKEAARAEKARAKAARAAERQAAAERAKAGKEARRQQAEKERQAATAAKEEASRRRQAEKEEEARRRAAEKEEAARTKLAAKEAAQRERQEAKARDAAGKAEAKPAAAAPAPPA
ncbi:MAG TPA: hypothetical protein VHI93_00890, partial [Candidatus Thermoplasmatota archaeon]|nr:hypothetical protein [Candidatus Thermoplasmatota archaeon]